MDVSEDTKHRFRLYILPNAPASEAAHEVLKEYCDQHLAKTGFAIEVIDAAKERKRAQEDDILLVPTLLRTHPQPEVRVLPNITDVRQLVRALGSQASQA